VKSETNIQIELWKLIKAYRLPHVLIWHVPNGEKRSPRTAKRLKEMGVTPGVPDFGFIAGLRGPGFLELKKEDGRLSEEQLDFVATAARYGVAVDVAHSVIEGAIILQQRGVLDPTIKFTVLDDPPSDRGARGRTARAKTVRPSNTERAGALL
jgi:hypothetical protein